MDQLIAKILAGDLDAASLLILFIVGILTKRFVPWWIYEDVVRKLDAYEAEAPVLIESIGELMAAMEKNKMDYEERQKLDKLKPRIEEAAERHGSPIGNMVQPKPRRTRRTRGEGDST